MHEDETTWLKFASLCRKSERPQQALGLLHKLLGYDPRVRPAGQAGYGAGSGKPHVMLAYLKHMWYSQDQVGAGGCMVHGCMVA